MKVTRWANAAGRLRGEDLLYSCVHGGVERLDLRRGRVAWRRGAGAAGHGAVGLRWLWTCGEYRRSSLNQLSKNNYVINHRFKKANISVQS